MKKKKLLNLHEKNYTNPIAITELTEYPNSVPGMPN